MRRAFNITVRDKATGSRSLVAIVKKKVDEQGHVVMFDANGLAYRPSPASSIINHRSPADDLGAAPVDEDAEGFRPIPDVFGVSD